MKYLSAFLMIAAMSAAAVLCYGSEATDPAALPSLMDYVRISGPLDFCGESVELEIQDVRERLEKELLLTLWDRPQVVLWIKRSERYFPIIEKMLQDNNMPLDLKYIAIIESALRPHVGSRKGAIGFWQFMEATGRKYGLTINFEKDERRNIFKSTAAAITYFKELYELLGSWTLAAAAYNMGEQGLQSEVLSQGTANYYRLYLPLETQRYVLRAVSAKIILSDPEAYGFRFSQEDLYPPLQFDPVQFECFQETPISIVAQAAGTYFKMIKDLNPEIRGHYLAAGSHWLLVPPGAAAGFQARFKKLVDQWSAESRERIYVVRQGDNLSTIAERFNVPLPALIIWNRLANKKHIYPGDRLVIYSPEMGSPEEEEEEEAAVPEETVDE